MAVPDLPAFTRLLGVNVLHRSPERSEAELPVRAELCNRRGVLHGGAVMALADSAGGACAFLHLPEGSQGTTTVESKTNFLRGVREGYIEAVSRPLHIGRTVIVVETDVRDQNDRLVARVTQTQLVLA